MPADILQENLGQGDPRTTARYFRAQIERRQGAMEKVFGEQASIDPDTRQTSPFKVLSRSNCVLFHVKTEEGKQVEPDWDLVAQPAPEFDVDQSDNW